MRGDGGWGEAAEEVAGGEGGLLAEDTGRSGVEEMMRKGWEGLQSGVELCVGRHCWYLLSESLGRWQRRVELCCCATVACASVGLTVVRTLAEGGSLVGEDAALPLPDRD